MPIPNGPPRFMYGKSRAQVKARLTEARQTLDAGKPLGNTRETFGSYLEGWMRGLPATNVKPSTVAYYCRYIRNHVMTSDLARKPLTQLEAADLRRLYAEKGLSGLSSTTVHHLHAVIHVALTQAVDDGKVARNVAALVGRTHRPKVARHEMATIADEDKPQRFVAAARGDRLGALLVVAISTGIRQGELRALRWKDVDLDGSQLSVTGSLSGTKRSDFVIGTPKSGKGRSLALGPIAVSVLRDHRHRQAEAQLLLGAEWQARDLVFPNEFGDYLSPTTMNRALQRVLERAGLPRIRFHDLRRTAATIMLSNGAHPKIVSEMLGHSTIAITLDLYSHVTPNMQREAAAAMDRAFVDPSDTGVAATTK
ncbi:MAG TPA: site-specific integrase [Chloroflexota bacterium]